jgi:hypothetical protein
LNFLLLLCRLSSPCLSLFIVVCIKLSFTHLHIVDNSYLPINLTSTKFYLPSCSVGSFWTNGQLFLKHLWHLELFCLIAFCVFLQLEAPSFMIFTLELVWTEALGTGRVLISWVCLATCRSTTVGCWELLQELAFHNTQIQTHIVMNCHTPMLTLSGSLISRVQNRARKPDPMLIGMLLCIHFYNVWAHTCFLLMLMFDCFK